MLHGALAWRHHPWFPPAATLMAIAVVSTAILGGVGYEVADRLIHPPRDVLNVDPWDHGIAFSKVAFPASDGVGLVGWWMPATAEKLGTVVFLHGYGASKAQSLAVAPFLVAAGYNVLAFDFRAHGESGGSYTTVGLEEARDVVGAYRWVEARPDVDPTRVAVFGWSMGAAAGLNAGRELPEIRAFISDSAFARLDATLSHTLPGMTGLPYQPFGTLGILFASWMVHRSVWENQPASAAAHIERPLLVIQGMSDRIARPEADGAALAQAAGPFSELWLVPASAHVDAARVAPEEYERRILEFLGLHVGAHPEG